MLVEFALSLKPNAMDSVYVGSAGHTCKALFLLVPVALAFLCVPGMYNRGYEELRIYEVLDVHLLDLNPMNEILSNTQSSLHFHQLRPTGGVL
jgi:hypothetical protein